MQLLDIVGFLESLVLINHLARAQIKLCALSKGVVSDRQMIIDGLMISVIWQMLKR